MLKYLILSCFLTIPARISAQNILVATGSVEEDTISEVFNIEAETSCNVEIDEFPIETSFGTGGLVGGKPLICGGKDSDSERSDECYILRNNEWEFLAKMNSKRSSLSSAVTPDGNSLFITGGRAQVPGEDYSLRTDTTEFVSIDGTVREGPKMPEKRSGHCMVNFGEDKTIIMGGKTKRKTVRSTVIFDHSTNTFSEGPDMVHKRIDQGCAVFNSPIHSGRPVVVVGGIAKPNRGQGGQVNINSLEAWDFTQPGTSFETISSLPRRFRQGRIFLIPTPNESGLIMEFDRDIYEFVCNPTSNLETNARSDASYVESRNAGLRSAIVSDSDINCIWEKKKEGLRTKRLDGVAIDLGPDFECEIGKTDLDPVIDEIVEIGPENNIEAVLKTDFDLPAVNNAKTALESTTEYVETRGGFFS